MLNDARRIEIADFPLVMFLDFSLVSFFFNCEFSLVYKKERFCEIQVKACSQPLELKQLAKEVAKETT